MHPKVDHLIPVLRTKILLPKPHPETTPRPILEQRVRSALTGKMVLVTAPAGYGKTTLLARVLADSPFPVAWLSLDERDNLPQHFWSYVIAALQAILPHVGQTSLELLKALQPPPFELVLVELLNDLANVNQEFILVLDDYHDITLDEIHHNLAELIAKMPVQMHLMLAGRHIPPLPLARLRARREVQEFSLFDLRFQPVEIEQLFNQLFRLHLNQADLAALENLTEGWIAGLQLAALVLKSQEPAEDAVDQLSAAFAGGHQYVFDYLAQEVLDRQEPVLRNFILQTGMLPRLCAPLCDQIFERADSQALLEKIASANLFLLPLDAERHWYRYHHLFANFLQSVQQIEQPAEVTFQLVRRAAGWYESQGLIHEALYLASKIGDHALLAQIIERKANIFFDNSELVALTQWLRPLPVETFEQHPQLGMIFAWALLAIADTERIETVLRAVERGVGCAADGSPQSFAQSPQVRGSLAEICCVRASQAINHFDLPAVLHISQLVRQYLSGHTGKSLFNQRTDILSVNAFNEGLGLSFTGQTSQAIASLEEAVRLSEQAGNKHLVPMACSQLSSLYLVQGQLHQAQAVLLKAIPADEAWHKLSPLVGVALTRLGMLFYERNQLAEAQQHLEKGLELGRRWSSWESKMIGRLGLARLFQALGEPELARMQIELLASPEFEHDEQYIVQALPMYRAELAVRQGDVASAAEWLTHSGMQVDSPIHFFSEEAMILLTRILVALQRHPEALDLAERLICELEQAGRMGRVLELLILKAVVLERQQDWEPMNRAFERALGLAKPEGFKRLFLDVGSDFQRVAKAYTGSHREYLNLLQNSLVSPPSSVPAQAERAGALQVGGVLSVREVEVLRLVAQGMTNQEIADHLYISLNTVKTHIRHIFQNLEARNRAEAIAYARANQLI